MTTTALSIRSWPLLTLILLSGCPPREDPKPTGDGSIPDAGGDSLAADRELAPDPDADTVAVEAGGTDTLGDANGTACVPMAVPALDDVQALTFDFFSVADASSTHESVETNARSGTVTSVRNDVRSNAELEYQDFQRLGGLLARPEVLRALSDSCPCGSPSADYTVRSVLLVQGQPDVRKDITYCKAPAYGELIAFGDLMRARYGAGTKCALGASPIPRPTCVQGVAGGPCSDSGYGALCDGEQWRCPNRTAQSLGPLIPGSQCRCTGAACENTGHDAGP